MSGFSTFTAFDSDVREKLLAIFNSCLTSVLLSGIYTAVYIGTMFLCLTNKNAPNATVLAALTLLYACSTVGLAREWDMVLTLIPENGHSVLDLLDSPSIDFGTSIVVKQLAVDMGLVIADALLVWRCYRVWGSSFRVIVPSLILLLTELSLYLSSDIVIRGDNPSTISGDLKLAGYLTTLILKLWSTFLIVYRVYTASQGTSKFSKLRFNYVIGMIVQSSAVHLIALIFNLVLKTLPENFANTVSGIRASNTASAMLLFTTGFAPTLMVGRLALGTADSLNEVDTASISSRLDAGGQNMRLKRDVSRKIYQENYFHLPRSTITT